VQIFRDEGEDGEKKRDWKDEKKSDEALGENHDEKDEEKGGSAKDKVGSSASPLNSSDNSILSNLIFFIPYCSVSLYSNVHNKSKQKAHTAMHMFF
jgi:hypothetical protein